MNLDTAASIGLGLLKHRKEIGAGASIMAGGLAGLATGTGKLVAGQGFSKIAEKFNLPELADKVTNALDNGKKDGLSSLQAVSYLAHFDTDSNGVVTREELTQGVQRLEESGLAVQGVGQRIHNLGKTMLQHYDKVAALDSDTSGISYRDLGKLVSQDEQIARLSAEDWNKLNA